MLAVNQRHIYLIHFFLRESLKNFMRTKVC